MIIDRDHNDLILGVNWFIRLTLVLQVPQDTLQLDLAYWAGLTDKYSLLTIRGIFIGILNRRYDLTEPQQLRCQGIWCFIVLQCREILNLKWKRVNYTPK